MWMDGLVFEMKDGKRIVGKRKCCGYFARGRRGMHYESVKRCIHAETKAKAKKEREQREIVMKSGKKIERNPVKRKKDKKPTEKIERNKKGVTNRKK